MSATEEHLRAAQPRLREIGVNFSGLRGRDGFDPVGEEPGRRDLAGHVRVIEVAVGVDQARQQDRFAKIHNRFADGNGLVAPAGDGSHPVS